MTTKKPMTTNDRCEKLNQMALAHMKQRGVDAVRALTQIAHTEAAGVGIKLRWECDAKIVLEDRRTGDEVLCWLVPVEGVETPSIESGTIGFELGECVFEPSDVDF